MELLSIHYSVIVYPNYFQIIHRQGYVIRLFINSESTWFLLKTRFIYLSCL